MGPIAKPATLAFQDLEHKHFKNVDLKVSPLLCASENYMYLLEAMKSFMFRKNLYRQHIGMQRVNQLNFYKRPQ